MHLYPCLHPSPSPFALALAFAFTLASTWLAHTQRESHSHRRRARCPPQWQLDTAQETTIPRAASGLAAFRHHLLDGRRHAVSLKCQPPDRVQDEPVSRLQIPRRCRSHVAHAQQPQNYEPRLGPRPQAHALALALPQGHRPAALARQGPPPRSLAGSASGHGYHRDLVQFLRQPAHPTFLRRVRRRSRRHGHS